MVRRLLLVLGAIGLAALFAGVVGAQDDATAAEPEATKSWIDLFQTTGIVGVLLLLCSLIGTGLLIQYLVTINENSLGNPEFMTEIENLLTEGNVDDAFTMAEADNTYAGKVVLGALGRSAGGYDEAQKGLEETSAVETFRLNAKISYLSLIGNIGPLLGLLGTVTGMITSFQKIETMKAPTPADLAVGVYESLVNTTIGLFIAIIFLSAYFFMKNKVSDITLRINNHISELLTRALGQASQESRQ